MKKTLAILFAMMLTLTACATETSAPSSSEESAPPSSSAVESEAPVESSPEDDIPARLRDVDGTPLADFEVDPPYDFDPYEVNAQYFGDYFTNTYENNTVSTYKIGEGTEWENEVVLVESGVEGPTMYVIAGVHGDETAAWIAGVQIEDITIKSGTLHVLAPANKWGAAQEPPTRYVTEQNDLNRSFPGDPNGTSSEQVAAIIYADVQRVNPDFVFDLHEARVVKEGRDFLGNSLIFTNMYEYDGLFWDMIFESQAGELFERPYDFFTPGPAGSVNNTISTELEIPVITMETFRGYDMERRVRDQLAVVQRVMQEMGMVD